MKNEHRHKFILRARAQTIWYPLVSGYFLITSFAFGFLFEYVLHLEHLLSEKCLYIKKHLNLLIGVIFVVKIYRDFVDKLVIK